NEQMLLEVVFNGGAAYHYFDVPPQLVDEFKAAESKGVFLAERVKGHYRYSKV
ncbi:KTSC domain-containing protein, partial [Mesorhizobium sp. M7A.F.Ca.US.003.02.1.1]